jgi:hypothetical protein
MESRWRQRAGPGILVLGLLGLLGAAPAGAREETWSPPDCGPQAVVRPAVGEEPRTAAWYRIDPRLDEHGTLVGQRLVAGGGPERRSRTVDLAAESFAAGPFGDVVLTGSDDGRQSALRLIDLAAGCSTTIAAERDVIRRATVDPAGFAVYEFRVARTDRADLGVWRRPLDVAARPDRVLPPIAPDERFGPTYLTELSWSLDGSRLVVQSCGQAACRSRVLDIATGDVVTLDDPDLGDAIGLAGDHLVSYLACRGMPCPIVAIELDSGARNEVTEAAGFAALVATDDGPRIVYEPGDALDGSLRVADATGRDRGRLDGDPGLRLVPGPLRAAAGVDAPAGWLSLAPDGRPAAGQHVPAVLRQVSDGRIVDLEEASR